MSAENPEVGDRWHRQWDGKMVTVTQIRGSRVRFVVDGAPRFEPDYSRQDFLELHRFGPAPSARGVRARLPILTEEEKAACLAKG